MVAVCIHTRGSLEALLAQHLILPYMVRTESFTTSHLLVLQVVALPVIVSKVLALLWQDMEESRK